MSFKRYVDQAVDLYRHGFSLAWIGEQYHVNRQTVAYNLQLFGEPLRARGGANNPEGKTGVPPPRNRRGQFTIDVSRKPQ